MLSENEIHNFLFNHLQAIYNNDIETYHATTSEDLTLYEWWVTPHRLEGLPFHDYMMAENSRRGIAFGAELKSGVVNEKPHIRFDLANLRIQLFNETAVASYTLLTSTGTDAGVNVSAHNETRVIVNSEGTLKVVHVHKSPAWKAPHVESDNPD